MVAADALVVDPEPRLGPGDRAGLGAWVAFAAAALVVIWLGRVMRRTVFSQEAARREAEDVRRWLDLALDAGGMGVWSWDPASGRVTWSPQLEEIYGLEAGTFAGTMDAYLAGVHPDDRKRVLRGARSSLRWRGRHEVEHRVLRPDGSVRWVWGRGHVTRDPSGRVTGMAGVAVDVTERRRREAREALLARVGEELASSLRVEVQLHRLARLVASSLADACAVEALGGLAGDPVVVLATRVGGGRAVTSGPAPATLRSRRPREVARAFRAVYLPEVTAEMLDELRGNGAVVAALGGLSVRSYAAVPLLARGQTLGVIAIASTREGGRIDPHDLAVVEEVAARAAVAIDNARLYERQLEIATVLQQSLLPPELPTVPGLELAALYVAPGEGIDVGGDFYDVFATGRDTWAVVVGDVCGKGPAAAALTALARYTIRAAALRNRAPSRILRDLNEALLRQRGDGRFLTLACASLAVSRRPARLTVATAGHPPPLVLRADGSVERVQGNGTVVGVFGDFASDDVEIPLGPSDAIVFYTDGVIEARAGVELFGLDRLERLLRDCAGMSARDLVAEVARRVATFRDGPASDDTAIVVLAPEGARSGRPPAAVTAGATGA
jgi:PAS domain S-box-containing protein